MPDRFFKDSVFYSISMILPALVGFALVAVFSHRFDTASYGQYALAMVVVTLISTVTTGWTDQAILRFEPETDTETLLTNVLSVVLGVSVCLVVGAVVLWYGELVPGEYERFVVPLVTLAVAMSAFRVYQSIYQSKLQAASLTGFKIFRAVLKFVGAVGIALFVLEDITGWIWGTALATVLTTVVMAKSSGIFLPTLDFDRALLRRMLVYGIPLVGWAMTHKLLGYGDRVILQALEGSSAVGIYAANYTLAQQSFALVSGPVIMAVHPLVMNAWDGSNVARISQMMRKYTRYFIIIGVPAVIYISVLSAPVASLMLSDAYVGGYVIIPIVAAGSFVWGVSNIGHKGLEAEEKTATMLVGAVVTVVFNLVLNVPLIRLYGFFGAALATLLSFSVYPVFVYWVTRNSIPWRIASVTLRNVTLAGLPVVAVYWLLWQETSYDLATTMLATVPTGILYLSLLYALDEPTDAEMAIVSETWQRVVS